MTETKLAAFVVEPRPSSARVCTLCMVTRLPRNPVERQAFVSGFPCHKADDDASACSWCKRTRSDTLRCLVCRKPWRPRDVVDDDDPAD